MRFLWAEVGNGFEARAIRFELVDPKRILKQNMKIEMDFLRNPSYLEREIG